MLSSPPSFGALAQKPRQNNFDFLRFVLAALVIYHHSFPLLHGESAGSELEVWTHNQMAWGAIAVNSFF